MPSADATVRQRQQQVRRLRKLAEAAIAFLRQPRSRGLFSFSASNESAVSALYVRDLVLESLWGNTGSRPQVSVRVAYP